MKNLFIVLALLLISPAFATDIVQQSPTTFNEQDFNRNNGVIGLLSSTVANNAILKTRTGSVGQRMLRSGFTTAGDGGTAPYYWSATNCVTADDGAQVQPTGITGCWIADFTGMQPTPKIWGAKGDGTTDDSIPLQNAINARANKTLQLGSRRYLISTGLTSTVSITIEGVNAKTTPYAQACDVGASTLVVRSNINALTLTGLTGKVSGVCFEMGTAAGQRTSGYALKMGGTATTHQGHGLIENNTVIFAYDGILVGGATTGTGSQTNGNTAANNLIISAANDGIAIGKESSQISNPGTTIRDNQIVCYGTHTTGTGIALYDGAIMYYGSDGGPYSCNIGFKIAPGKANNLFQGAMGRFQGVIGDSSNVADLDINTTDPSAIVFLSQFVNSWVSSVSATDTPLRIRNTGGGQVRDILFSGSMFHMAANQTVPGIDIGSGVSKISFTGNHIMSETGGTAVKVASGANNLAFTGNKFNPNTGLLAVGIDLPATGNLYSVVGNSFSNTTLPISYPLTTLDVKSLIVNNEGVDDSAAAVAVATTVALPPNPVFNLTGTGTITTLTGLWAGREVKLFNNGIVTFASGGNLCNNSLLTYPTFSLIGVKAIPVSGCVSVFPISPMTPSVKTVEWSAASDPNRRVAFTAGRAMSVADIRGRVTTPTGAIATITVNKVPNGSDCTSGTPLHTGTFNANGTANTNQVLTLNTGSTILLNVGDTVCLATSGTWTGPGVGSISITTQ